MLEVAGNAIDKPEGLSPQPVTAGGLEVSEMTTQKALQILTDERSVVITEKLARRRGFTIGGEIRLMIGDRVGSYVVRGLLKDEGPARVLDGNFLLMDIAAAQLAFDRLSRVDRIDVLLPEGARPRSITRRHRETGACRV